MPKPGEIYHYKNFNFPNGDVKSKYFLILNETDSLTTLVYLVLLLTSRLERYPGVIKGCYEEFGVFIISAGEAGLSKNTAIQMPAPKRGKIWPFNVNEMLTLGLSKVIEHQGSLTEDRFREVLNCLKRFKPKFCK